LDNFKREPFPIKESITTFENIPILKKEESKGTFQVPALPRIMKGP